MKRPRKGKKKLGVALSLNMREIKRLSETELEERFQKRVFPAIINRIKKQAADDPWHQWSYGFF